MLNLFIAIIIAFGFWTKATNDVKNKIRNASWTRTFVLLCLSVILTVFYIKTNEIAVIVHQVDVIGMRDSKFKDSHKPADAVSIHISNRFDNNSRFKKLKNFPDVDYGSRLDEYGGISYTLYLNYNRDSCIIKQEETEVDNMVNLDGIDNISHAYYISSVVSRIPSFWPIHRDYEPENIELSEDSVINNVSLLYRFNMATLNYIKKSNKENGFTRGTEETLDFFGPHGLGLVQFVCSQNTDSLSSGFITYNVPAKMDIMNSMNVFSACDLSQCTVELGINSTCPINSLLIDFDVPIEVLPGTVIPDHVDLYKIGFKDSISLSELNHKLNMFHFKLPTQANVQLVRSLILTTLLTALWSIFATNIYYAIRKQANKSKRKRKLLKYRYALKLYKNWIRPFRIIIVVLLFLITLTTLLNFFNHPVFVYNIHIIIIIASILLLSLIILSTYLIKKKIFKANELNIEYPEEKNDNPIGEKLQELERKYNPYILFCPKCGSEKIDINKDGMCKCQECQEEWKEFDVSTDGTIEINPQIELQNSEDIENN